LGRLDSVRVLVQDIAGWVQRAGFLAHPIRIEHAQRAGVFPHPHRDPFDRMIAAQSLLDALPVVSKDDDLDRFGVRRVW
jgi:PIN domain nuclease of toxin-antitoxin system